MARLPQPGADNGTWGSVLNEYLSVGHNPDGTHKSGIFNVKDYGAKGDGVTDDTVSILAAMTAAGKGEVFFPMGTYLTASGLSLFGKTCSIRGVGEGTVIKGTGSAAVLDFTGYSYPGHARYRRYVRDFAVEGNSTSGSTQNIGIKLAHVAGIEFSNISINNTGGACIDAGSSLLCDFYGIILSTPAGAKTFDVPYFKANGSFNGNRMIGIGLRSIIGTGDMGASGAVVIKNDNTYAPELNLFQGWWYEFLHPVTDSSYFYLAGNTNVISDFQFHDAAKESGATNTSFFTLDNPTAGANFGGNIIRGLIPGNGGTALNIDTGVLVKQSRNLIEGVKGYVSKNVTLNPGVIRTTVILAGSQSGFYPGIGVIDNSGTNNNTLIDYVDQKMFTGSGMSMNIKAKAGAVTDADFGSVAPPNGTIAVDTANSKFYVRIGGVWKSAALT